MKWANMNCGLFLRISFKLGDVRRKLGRNSRPIRVMEKRIIDELAKIRKAQASHIWEQ